MMNIVPTSENKTVGSPDTGGKLTLLRALATRNHEIAKIRNGILTLHLMVGPEPICVQCGCYWPCPTVRVVSPDLPNPSPPL